MCLESGSCSKEYCTNLWFQIISTVLCLSHFGVIIKVIFCLIFPCPLLERHVFHAIRLLLHLEPDVNENGDPNSTLISFYAYLVAIHMLSTWIYGIAAAGCYNFFYLICMTVVGVLNIVQASGFLVFLIYIGIELSLLIQDGSVLIGIMLVLELTVLSLVAKLLSGLCKEREFQKKVLHRARLIHNHSTEEPLLVP